MRSGLRERHRFGNGVVERRAASRHDAAERRAEAIAIGRPPGDELGTRVEPVQKYFIFAIEQIEEKPVERPACSTNLLASHAAARIEGDTEADRNAFVVEVRDALLDAVLVDAKVLTPEIRYEAAGSIGDRGGHVDQLHAGAKPE